MRRRQAGFTYLGLIVFVTIIGLVGAATLKVGALLQRAAAEEELLDIGAAFSAALDSYAAATPPGATPYPPSLKELLKDPRTPGVRRHLRKIFVDPLTGKAEWGIEFLGGGQTGVVAIHSLSQAAPLKVGNFDSRFRGLDNKDKIAEWRFTARDLSVSPAGVQRQPGAATPPAAAPAPGAIAPAPAAPSQESQESQEQQEPQEQQEQQEPQEPVPEPVPVPDPESAGATAPPAQREEAAEPPAEPAPEQSPEQPPEQAPALLPTIR